MSRRSPRRRVARAPLAVALSLALTLGACAGAGTGPSSLVIIPAGASLEQATDSLAAHGLISYPAAFRFYVRLSGAAQEIKAGAYRFKRGVGWATMLDDLRHARVVTERLTIPEAWNAREDAPRIAAITRLAPDSVLRVLQDTAMARRYHVPGPTLEGYLYPATYTLSPGVPLDLVLRRMTRRYRQVWTPARQAAADSLDLDQRQIVTLASIVEREAKIRAEMPHIAAVYLNRLRLHMLLQADPTVQYALGQHHTRLLYADIDSVAHNPYNTYTHPGLPPGPIASPSAQAIDAVLHAAHSRDLYFVAAPDGTHVFTRTLAGHNAAKRRIERLERRAREAARADSLRRARHAHGGAPPP